MKKLKLCDLKMYCLQVLALYFFMCRHFMLHLAIVFRCWHFIFMCRHFNLAFWLLSSSVDTLFSCVDTSWWCLVTVFRCWHFIFSCVDISCWSLVLISGVNTCSYIPQVKLVSIMVYIDGLNTCILMLLH